MGPSEVQLALPICSSRDDIVKAVTDNQIVVVEAPTGSGKTTQLPQVAQGVPGKAGGPSGEQG